MWKKDFFIFSNISNSQNFRLPFKPSNKVLEGFASQLNFINKLLTS